MSRANIKTFLQVYVNRPGERYVLVGFWGCKQNIIKLPCVVCCVLSTYCALEGERLHTQCTESKETLGPKLFSGLGWSAGLIVAVQADRYSLCPGAEGLGDTAAL